MDYSNVDGPVYGEQKKSVGLIFFFFQSHSITTLSYLLILLLNLFL